MLGAADLVALPHVGQVLVIGEVLTGFAGQFVEEAVVEVGHVCV